MSAITFFSKYLRVSLWCQTLKRILYSYYTHVGASVCWGSSTRHQILLQVESFHHRFGHTRSERCTLYSVCTHQFNLTPVPKHVAERMRQSNEHLPFVSAFIGAMSDERINIKGNPNGGYFLNVLYCSRWIESESEKTAKSEKKIKLYRSTAEIIHIKFDFINSSWQIKINAVKKCWINSNQFNSFRFWQAPSRVTKLNSN